MAALRAPTDHRCLLHSLQFTTRPRCRVRSTVCLATSADCCVAASELQGDGSAETLPRTLSYGDLRAAVSDGAKCRERVGDCFSARHPGPLLEGSLVVVTSEPLLYLEDECFPACAF